MEHKMYTNYFKNLSFNLWFEKELVEQHFDWIRLTINGATIQGKGSLDIHGKVYDVTLEYNPGLFPRPDRIFIKGIKYHPKIHTYPDDTLCLYYPEIDRSPFRILPLVSIISWITEWCVHYEEWKKYKVWLGREIEH